MSEDRLAGLILITLNGVGDRLGARDATARVFTISTIASASSSATSSIMEASS
ncbi:MAG: hypothetical protein R2722_10920 [Tessaracoccus sp.]